MAETKNFTGIVNFFNDRKAFGSIKTTAGEEVKVLATAITGRSLKTLCKGERVSGTAHFMEDELEWRATEVMVINKAGAPEVGDPTSNAIDARVAYIGGYGGSEHYRLITGPYDNIYLYVSKILKPLSRPLKVDDIIQCIIIETIHGYQAIVPPEDTISVEQEARFDKPSDYYLSQALLQRDAKKYDKARQFFEDGLREAPNHKLFSAYAAMERNLNEYNNAIGVLQQAIAQYPKLGKFYEELGNLLLTRKNYKEAIDIFKKGIENDPRHRVLYLFLAKSFYGEGGEHNLRQALGEFEKIKSVLRLSAQDSLIYNKLRVHFEHRRGKSVLDFLNRSNLQLDMIQFHDIRTYAVDILVTAKSQEYIKTYDLKGNLFIRCYFQNVVTPEDVMNLLENRSQLLDKAGVNPDVLFIVVQNTEKIREFLYRQNDKLTHPTVVPLPEKSLMLGAQGFRDALDEWLFRRDLYDYKHPVFGRRFFGREAEIKRIGDTIEDREWIGIFGLRKIGKTSLVEEIARRRTKDVIARCDLLKHAGMPSCDSLYVEIARQFNTDLLQKYASQYQKIKQELYLLPNADNLLQKDSLTNIAVAFEHDMEVVRASFASSRRKLPKFLVILDEIERLLPLHNQPGINGYEAFLGYLRGEAQGSKMISLLVVGANPMISEMARWGDMDNPLFEFVSGTYLPPFNNEECSELITKLGLGMGIEYTDEALEAICHLTGGHPYISRQYCSFLSKQFPSRPLEIDREVLEKSSDLFVFERSNVFQEILERIERDFPIEKELLMFIADGVNSDKELAELAGQSCQDALRHLKGYQLIRSDNNNYVIRIGLLEIWLHRNWLGR